MQLRMKLYKRRKLRELRGYLYGEKIMRCSKCQTTGHFVLWEGGLCKRCYVPKPIKYTPQEPAPTGKPKQLKETAELKLRCEVMMKLLNLPMYKLAPMLGMTKSTMSFWFHGHFTQETQRYHNRRIAEGLERMRQENAA